MTHPGEKLTFSLVGLFGRLLPGFIGRCLGRLDRFLDGGVLLTSGGLLLALGHGMIGRAANVPDTVALEIVLYRLGHEVGTVVVELSGPVREFDSGDA